MVPVVGQFTMKGARTLDASFRGWGVALSGPPSYRGHKAPLYHTVPPALVRVSLPGTAFPSSVEDVTKDGGGAAEGCAQMTSDLEPRDRQPTGRGVCAGGMIYLGISFSISGRVCLPRSSHPPASVLVASRGHFMRPSHPLREEEVVVSVSTDEETET